MKFSELNLHPKLQKNLDDLGFEKATPIQEESYSHIAAGKDLAGLAQTGTGKTAAFLIPLIQRLLIEEEPEDGSVKSFGEWTKTQFILVLVPTRELAEQVHDNVKKLIKDLGFTSAVLYGGTSYDNQKAALNEGADIVVSTPGRLMDLYKDHFIDLKQARAVVFDEADRMFDMGFKDDMCFILERVPRDRQYLVYSATLDFEVLNVAYEFGANPIEVNVSKDETKAENVTHEILHLGQKEKPQFLLSIIKKVGPKQIIIFTNFKSNVDRVANFLNKNDIRAHGISSLLNQKQRLRIMNDFKEGKVPVLVATDVAARGLDVKNIDLVVNFDLPDDAATYIHRIGRTGRAEAKGVAYSMVSDLDVPALTRIEALLGEKIGIGWLETSEILTDFVPFPERPMHKRLQGVDRKRQNANKRPSRPSKPRPKGDRRNKPRASGDEAAKAEKGEKRYANKDPKKTKSFKEADGQVHRDRKSGRHSTKSRKKKSASANANTRKRTSSNQKRRVKPPVPPSKRSSANSSSVGDKVKGFIKGLFS